MDGTDVPKRFSAELSACRPPGSSSSLWNETWTPGRHYIIEPLSRFDLIDFCKRIFWKSGNVEILPRACRSRGGGKQRGTTLYRPGQQHLCGRLPDTCGNGGYDCVFKRPRLYTMTQGGKGQEHNILGLTEFQKLSFRQIGMRFDLNHGRFYSRGLINRQ